MFWKADTWDRQRNLETASSGRTILWAHNLNLFLEMPLYRQLIGSGLGSESKNVIGGEDEIWSSHNDYISLLMTLGVMGLIMHFSIIIALIIETLSYSNNTQAQTVYLLTIVSGAVICILTNGYVFRFEASQTFWLIMGCGHQFIIKKLDQDSHVLIQENETLT